MPKLYSVCDQKRSGIIWWKRPSQIQFQAEFKEHFFRRSYQLTLTVWEIAQSEEFEGDYKEKIIQRKSLSGMILLKSYFGIERQLG